MGCLFHKLSRKSLHVIPEIHQNLEEKNQVQIQKKKIGKEQYCSNRQSQQKLIIDNCSYLLTDSSGDDQEIDLFDEQLKFRRNQLMQKKKKNLNYLRKYKSLNDLDKCSKNELKIKKSCSLGQISKINNSINMFYYEKFQSLKKIQKKPQIEQMDSILIEIDEQNKLFLENNEEKDNASSFSSMNLQEAQCQNCKKIIEDDQYQLECLHIFDTECLVKLIINQIQKDQIQIYCVCQQIIKTKLLKQILTKNVEQGEQYLEKLFANQYQNLKLIIQ